MTKLTTPERHQLKIARATLKMSPVMAAVMGGPTHEEARAIILKLTGYQGFTVTSAQADRIVKLKIHSDVTVSGRGYNDESALYLKVRYRNANTIERYVLDSDGRLARLQ